MRRSGGPVDFLDIHPDIHEVLIGKPMDFLKDLWVTSLADPCVLWVRMCKIEPLGTPVWMSECPGGYIFRTGCPKAEHLV